MKYAVIYEHGPNDEGRETWSAYVPDLPGCISVGDSRAECEDMIREAIAAHIQLMREEGLPVPEPTSEAGMVTLAEVPAA
jgi:predicted RNase H-like HicB family nuclease